MTIFQEAITTSAVVHNMPVGSFVGIQTSANLTVAFWNPVTNAFGATIAITAPLGRVFCPYNKAQLTAANADVNIVLESR